MVEYVMNLSSVQRLKMILNNAVKEGNKNAYKEAGQLDILYKSSYKCKSNFRTKKKAVDKLQAHQYQLFC
jgi:hypothetical protein